MKINRINSISLAKILALTQATFGFIAGLFIAVMTFLGVNLDQNAAAQQAGFTGMGVMAIIAMPLIYGAVGFIGGWATGALYNFIVRWTGPLEIDVE